MAPEGWQRRAIRDFCTRLKRINSAGLDLEPLSITKDRGVILQSEKYNKRIATDPRKYVFAEDGDFAFDPMSLYYGAIGRVGGVGRGLVSPDYVVFKADQTVDSDFLLALLRFPEMHKLYESLSETGNTFGKRRRLYWSIFEDIALLLPTRAEQEKIAAVLASVDDVINAAQAVIEQVQVVKKAMVAELFTRGLPRKHTRYKQAEIGEIPDDWTVQYVEQFADVCTGDRDTQDRVPSGTYPFIVRSPTLERIDSYSFDGEAVLTAGDGVGTGKVFHYMKGKFSYHQRVYNVHNFRNGVLGRFFYYYFQHYFIGQVRKFSAKNSVDSVRRAMITRMPVPVPPLPEQRQIADALTCIDTRLEGELGAIQAMRLFRSALMSALLTGVVRLKPDEDAA